MDKTAGHILIDGNTAAALGCVYAGATVGAWYPITPSTSLMEAFKGFCERFRMDPETASKRYCDHPGRGRARGDRHGARRGVGRRARVHADERPRHLADERVHRPRVLRRDPGGDLRHPAHRSVDRHADAHAAGRHAARARTPRTATRKHIVLFPANPRGVLLPRGRGVRPRRAVPDAGVRAVGSRHRHERLDVQGARVGRRLSSRSRQGARPPSELESDQEVLTATSTSTATASPRARCRACIRRARTSRAARVTTSYGALHGRLAPSTSRGRRPARRASSHARGRSSCRRRSSTQRGRARGRHRRVGGCHAARARGASTGCATQGIAVDYMRIRAFPFGEEVRAFLDAHEHDVRRRAEPRRAAALAADARDRRRRREALPSILHYSGLPMSSASRGRGRRRSRSCRSQLPRRRRRMTLHRQTEGPSIPACRRTRSGSRGATTRARCRRCAPAAATTRSPPRSSRRSGSCDIAAASRREDERHRLLVEDDRVLPARARTASTPCTAACRRSRPARTPRTGSSRTSASRATATRCRSGSASSATRSAATSTCSTSSRTTACTA